MRDNANYMVELGRGRYIRIKFSRGIDERWIRGNTRCLQQRRQECMFIFAVAVLITQYVGSEVGLIAPNAKGHADIVKFGTHIII